jgi:HK97 gp10 family phage protein
MAATSKTSVTVRVVTNRLPQMSEAVHAAAVQQVKRSTLDVQARAQAVVPVLTGTLRRSITSQFTKGGLTGTCGPSVEYGGPVEFGTRHMAARPYMRPAAALVLPKFADELKAILGRIG